MRITDWSSEVCSSDLLLRGLCPRLGKPRCPAQVPWRTMKMSPPRLTRNRLPALSSPKDAIWLSVPASGAKSSFRRAKREDARVSPGTRLAKGTVQLLPELKSAKTYRSEEHKSELPSLMRIPYAVF